METLTGDFGFATQEEEDEHIQKIALVNNEEINNAVNSLKELLRLINEFNEGFQPCSFYLDDILHHRFVRHVIINGVRHLPPSQKNLIDELSDGTLSLLFQANPFNCRLEQLRLVIESGKRKWKHTGNIGLNDVKKVSAEKIGISPYTHDVELIL